MPGRPECAKTQIITVPVPRGVKQVVLRRDSTVFADHLG